MFSSRHQPGKLREADYPFASQSYVGSGGREKPSNVLVFIVGGCTFEEAKDMVEVSKETGVHIVLGGSCIHSSKTFLADVAQLARAQY